MSLKATQIIQIQNKGNEHYKTQLAALKQTNKSMDWKLILLHICSQQTTPKDKRQEWRTVRNGG